MCVVFQKRKIERQTTLFCKMEYLEFSGPIELSKLYELRRRHANVTVQF